MQLHAAYHPSLLPDTDSVQGKMPAAQFRHTSYGHIQKPDVTFQYRMVRHATVRPSKPEQIASHVM